MDFADLNTRRYIRMKDRTKEQIDAGETYVEETQRVQVLTFLAVAAAEGYGTVMAVVILQNGDYAATEVENLKRAVL